MQYKKIKIGAINSSNKELFDLAKAWFAVSLALGIALSKDLLSEGLTIKFFSSFITAAVVVGTAFILHEMAHKFLAQRYGHFAEFRSFDEMLIIAIIISFFGLVIAAPGAVVINARYSSLKQSGVISASGPLVNLVLALFFLGMLFFFSSGLGHQIAFYGFKINSWLALFNLIPAWMFDGKKVWDWNKAIWALMAAVSAVFVFVF